MSLRPRSELQKRILQSLARMPLDDRSTAYLERRGLLSVAERLGFGTVPFNPPQNLRQVAGRLVIPSFGPEGNVYDVTFRCIEDHDCKETGCRKYDRITGVGARLYNTRALAEAEDVVDLTEGQLDAAALEVVGFHAVGSPGASTWSPHHRRMFQDFDRVRVWPDGDESGKKWMRQVTSSLPVAEVMMVPWGKDVNQILIEQGAEGILRIAHGDNSTEHDEAAGWGLSPETDEIPF